jgi:hypothetical protein
MIVWREAALEYLDDDHAAAAARTRVRERLVGLGAVGIAGLGLCIDHARQHVGEVRVGFDAVEFAGFDQRTDDRPKLTTAVTGCKQVVLATSATGRIARSTGLVSNSMRPSYSRGIAYD